MAIKETPVLRGKNAERFFTKMKEEENQKASAAEKARIKSSFDRLSSIAQF